MSSTKNDTPTDLQDSDHTLNTGLLDAGKRQSLKLLGGAGLGLAAGGIAFVPQASAGTRDENPETRNHNVSRQHDIMIEIFSSTGVTGESVLIRNTTSDELAIAGFLPGTIVFGNRYVDLNELLANDGNASQLTITPGHTISFQANARAISENDSIHEYVWAESSKTQVTEDCVVVSLAGFMADDKLVVYPNPQLLVATTVETLPV